MEIFVKNIPYDTKPRTVDGSITSAVKKAFGSKAAFKWQPFKRSKGCGALTLPTIEMGVQFLTLYGRGLPIRDRRGGYRMVQFRQSNKAANPRLVEGLQKQMEETKQKQTDSDDDHEGEKHDLRFKSLEWGMWESGGSFARYGTLQFRGRLSYNSERGVLEIINTSETSPERDGEAGINIDNSSIKEMFVQGATISGEQRLYLTLDRIPRFWGQERKNSLHQNDNGSNEFSLDDLIESLAVLFGEELPVYRLPGLCSEHAIDSPYCTTYVFNLEDNPALAKTVRRMFKAMRRQQPHDDIPHIPIVDLNFSESHSELQELYDEHTYRIAFQMESFVRNCLLLPLEVISLNDQILDLVATYDSDRTACILQNFAFQLPIRTFERCLSLCNHSEMLHIAERSKVWEPEPDPNLAYIHRLDITPAAYNMGGPEWTGTNRILRLYPNHHDYFLKVSFTEEDISRIRQSGDMGLKVILDDRWALAFRSQGIELCGRQFAFLGFSQSSLKEHSVWFIAPFVYNDEIVNADNIRSDLGDFSHIKCAPRLAARIGLAFTTTSHSIDIQSDQVDKIEEVVVRSTAGDYMFSDGVGTISQDMLNRVWKATITNETKTKPVAYQIRLGGAKGVVSLDRTLKESQLCLRPSMIKFQAENTQLEIVSEARILPFFLNRQMIVILETLGLNSANLLLLQDLEVTKLKEAAHNFDKALRLCQQYGLGQGSKLSSILATLQSEGIEAIFEMPFFRKLNTLAISHALKQIKYKTRVTVDRSWKLMGVMDEFGYLKEGQVYICLKDDAEGMEEFVKGDTLVTRSPAMHCGDIQKVYAVGQVPGSHPLSALYNCIVFSSKGNRPIPNQLSGGDLDGDLYDISQNPLLFPPSWEPADSYPSVRPRESGSCTMEDVAKFFLNFIVNDNLGQICTRHSILADQFYEGAKSKECVQLSRLASVAVDYPKTGIPVNILDRDVPYVDSQIKPDFMAQLPLTEHDIVPGPKPRDRSPGPGFEGTRPDRSYFYLSHRVLGKMYRAVDIDYLLETWNANSGWNEDGPVELWKTIEDNLKTIVPSYKKKWAIYVQEAEEMFDTYMTELEIIQRDYHPTPWKKRLSESEVFLQCISMAATARSIRGRGKSDHLHQLRQEYERLIEWVLSEIMASAEGRFQRAAAYFYVGIMSVRGEEGNLKEGESFAWLVIPELFKAWRRVQENGFVDGEVYS